MNKYKTIIFLFFAFVISASAQELLTLQQAIEMALKNNYGILVAKANADIAHNNNSYGNSGFMPLIQMTASNNLSNANIKQDYTTGLTIDRKGVQTTNITAAPVLTWTLFDGLNMFATKEKFAQLQAQSEVGIKLEIENDLNRIITSYYNIVRQNQLIRAMYESVKVSEERIKIAEKKLEVGSASKLDLLQAKVDLNTQKSNILKLKADLAYFKALLNQLIVRTNDTDFNVSDTIPLTYKVSYNDLKESIPKQSDSIQYAQKNIFIAEQTLRQMTSLALPQIAVNGTYNMSKTHSQAGLVLINQNLGFNGGFTLTWNLFNGFKTDILRRNAQQQIMITKFQFDQTKKQIETSLLKAWNNYQYAIEALQLETENSAVARENLSIALERFRLGSASNVDINLAQQSFENAIARFVQAGYDAKVAETSLMKLNGDLVK